MNIAKWEAKQHYLADERTATIVILSQATKGSLNQGSGSSTMSGIATIWMGHQR